MSTLHVENLKGLSSGGNANKVIIPTGQTLQVTDNIRHVDMPTGSILQVLTQEITAYTSTTSTSAVATGFTLTITPKSTASKIRCTVGISGLWAGAITSSASFYLHKGGSFHKYLHAASAYSNPVTYSSDPTMQVTDSPSTTSAVTYAIFWKRSSGSGTIYFNNYSTANNETRSWYTIEEIAQ
jgi:hypothetical protein